MKSTFWTRRRFTGITLILGCLLYIPAIGFMPRDTQGNFLVNLSIRESLLVIAAQPSLYKLSFSLFICGTIVTLLGFALLTGLLRDAGDRTFSQLGADRCAVWSRIMGYRHRFVHGHLTTCRAGNRENRCGTRLLFAI